MKTRRSGYVIALVAWLALASVACERSAQRSQQATAAARGPSPVATQSFDGYVVPMNATEIRSPDGAVRLGGVWEMNTSWIKLQELTADGTAVKEGDVVARFEFIAERAGPWVDGEVRSAVAERDRAGLEKARQVEELLVDEKKKELEAERARLETLREGVISERDLEIARLAHQQANFDADAVSRHRRAVKRELLAEKAFHERNVARAESLQEHFTSYRERVQVRAPHDGVFRHVYSRRHRRKVEKGDGMPAGMHFASLARDAAVSVQFFIPEAEWMAVREVESFVVEAASAKRTWTISVDQIEPFPQGIGFLKKDDSLPNAREKAYVVWATFDEPPTDLSAGVEVRVRPR